MDQSSAEAYEYAKASGLLGKAFIGSRTQLLFQQTSLSDLWTLLYKTPAPMIPERLLAEEIEREAFKRLINQYCSFIGNWENAPEIIKEQLKIFEIENLKEISDTLCSGSTVLPEITDLGKYSELHLDKWPDLKAITADTEYSWFNKVPSAHEQQSADFKLDLYLIQSYWKEINKYSGDLYDAHLKLFLNDFVIKNVIWALRLSVYYGMEKEDVIKHLFYVGEQPSESDPVAGPAIKVLGRNPENRAEWDKWEYAEYLNPVTGSGWKIDPAYVERHCNQKKFKKAINIFHQYPMTSAALVAWFRIKRFELSCIRTAVESIRLNVKPQDAMASIGLTVQ